MKEIILSVSARLFLLVAGVVIVLLCVGLFDEALVAFGILALLVELRLAYAEIACQEDTEGDTEIDGLFDD